MLRRSRDACHFEGFVVAYGDRAVEGMQLLFTSYKIRPRMGIVRKSARTPVVLELEVQRGLSRRVKANTWIRVSRPAPTPRLTFSLV